MEFKRHSKSIDPGRHRCGGCRGDLVQVKPVPRRVNGGDGGKTAATPVSGYAGFVKLHFADLKRGMAGASHKEVMEALGRKYRAEKAGDGEEKGAVTVDGVAVELEGLKLGMGTSPVVIELD